MNKLLLVLLSVFASATLGAGPSDPDYAPKVAQVDPEVESFMARQALLPALKERPLYVLALAQASARKDFSSYDADGDEYSKRFITMNDSVCEAYLEEQELIVRVRDYEYSEVKFKKGYAVPPCIREALPEVIEEWYKDSQREAAAQGSQSYQLPCSIL